MTSALEPARPSCAANPLQTLDLFHTRQEDGVGRIARRPRTDAVGLRGDGVDAHAADEIRAEDAVQHRPHFSLDSPPADGVLLQRTHAFELLADGLPDVVERTDDVDRRLQEPDRRA